MSKQGRKPRQERGKRKEEQTEEWGKKDEKVIKWVFLFSIKKRNECFKDGVLYCVTCQKLV